jgi:predicted aspartyl protease
VTDERLGGDAEVGPILGGVCRRAIALLLTGVAGAVLAGCGSGSHSATRRASSARPLSVPLTVYRSHGVVVAFVRVAVEGHAYEFVVDTGAARTIIDARVARRLGLRDDGSPRKFATLGCEVSAQPVALPSWRLGSASFPATTVFSQRLLIPRVFSRLPLGGFLGSDFLSRFGTVTIDLTHRQLILGGGTHSGTGGHAVPIKILRLAGGTLATTHVELDHHQAGFVVDTGAASSVIDSRAATRLRLHAVGRRTSITGAVCRSTATPVFVHGWNFAVLRLPQTVIVRVTGLLPERVAREGVVGILGMATLARFGALTIDYSHATMILGGTGR